MSKAGLRPSGAQDPIHDCGPPSMKIIFKIIKVYNTINEDKNIKNSLFFY